MKDITYRQLRDILQNMSDARLDQPVTAKTHGDAGEETLTFNTITFEPTHTTPDSVLTLSYDYSHIPRFPKNWWDPMP